MFPGIQHVAVTVSDIDRSTAWYTQLFGSDPVLTEDTEDGFHHTVYALDGGNLFGLHTHTAGNDPTPFDEHRMGMDHIGFACADRSALEQWQAKLDELGVAHGGIVDRGYGSGLSFRDPDNIALEFFAPPAG